MLTGGSFLGVQRLGWFPAFEGEPTRKISPTKMLSANERPFSRVGGPNVFYVFESFGVKVQPEQAYFLRDYLILCFL
jgi:hypothetical protein